MSHAKHELSTPDFVSFGGNAEELLAREVGTFEFTVNGCVMDRDKTICLEKMEKFVQKPVWVGTHEAEKVLNIVVVESTGCRVVFGLLPHNVVGFPPESIDAIPRAGREVATRKNVGKVD